jgi:hypothetical protein
VFLYIEVSAMDRIGVAIRIGISVLVRLWGVQTDPLRYLQSDENNMGLAD